MTDHPITDILAPKPDANPRIYAYAIHDDAHAGLLKVGQTTRDVRQRVAEQLRTAGITNFSIEVDEPAARDDGSIITDHAVRNRLRHKGFANPLLEWMRCSVTAGLPREFAGPGWRELQAGTVLPHSGITA